MRAKIFLAAALCAIPLGAFAQSPSTSAAREIARLDREYSNLSVAKKNAGRQCRIFRGRRHRLRANCRDWKKYWVCRSDFPGTLSFLPVSDGVPFCLALKPGLWQKRKHDAVFHGRQRAQQADYTDFICL